MWVLFVNNLKLIELNGKSDKQFTIYTAQDCEESKQEYFAGNTTCKNIMSDTLVQWFLTFFQHLYYCEVILEIGARGFSTGILSTFSESLLYKLWNITLNPNP